MFASRATSTWRRSAPADHLLRECLDASCGPLVIDLSRVAFMDARGVSFLLRARTRADAVGRSLRLVFPSQAVTRVLEVGDVMSNFDVVPSLLDASHRELESFFTDVVERAIGLDGAPRGSAQLFDPKTGVLHLVAAPGFSASFHSHFEAVRDHRGASCGVAASTRRIAAVPDVAESPTFRGTPSLDVMLDERARACISVPIVADGVLLGMFSTHHERPRTWDVEAIRALEDLAAKAAEELAPIAAA